jgi:hypothetical protein
MGVRNYSTRRRRVPAPDAHNHHNPTRTDLNFNIARAYNRAKQKHGGDRKSGRIKRKKAPCDDPLERVTGSMGTVGAADCILVMTRVRTEDEAALFLDGRDLEACELAKRWDRDTG